MTQPFLPYGRQSIDADDIAAVTRVLRSDYLTTGPEIPAFEAEFAAAVDAPFAVACNSATAALHMALAGLGVGEGDVCIVPSITFLATANAARYCGAEVVFADVDPQTGLMTPETALEALRRADPRREPCCRCTWPAPCATWRRLNLARKAGLLVVEDSCHALGTVKGLTWPSREACMRSDAATFSFHPVKTLAAGEGGMMTTRDPNWRTPPPACAPRRRA
jgi:dTDP-4-amino-4,6-dideoxygalactose transaminase